MRGDEKGLTILARILSKTCLALFAATAVSGTAVLGLSTAAQAEATISVYGGANFSPHSRVRTKDAAGNITSSNSVGWDGASFQMPPYYGVRATWWLEQSPAWGFAVDFTHAKVKADPLPAGFTKLEFTDGINFLTANALYRWDMGNGWTPYVGAGVGLSIPHVEVDGPVVGNNQTLEYQVTGVAVQALAGVNYAVTDNWSLFGEFKSNYGVVDAELNGGGSLETDIISNQVIFGVTYKFF